MAKQGFRELLYNRAVKASVVVVALCLLICGNFGPSSTRSQTYKCDPLQSKRLIHVRQGSRAHSDWIWPLRYVPRRWTIVCGNPPEKTLGTTPLRAAQFHGLQFRYPQPIPPRGYWHFTAWPIYFGMSTRSGWHFRIGVRYDDIDGYYTWPSLTIKRLNPDKL
jgi:hypothetical protein